MDKLSQIKEYYDPKLKESGPDYKVLGWENQSAQFSRFEPLLTIKNLENKNILDVGCGLGSLLDFFKARKININYTGVDLLDEMIERAKLKHNSENFYCIDIFNNSQFEANSFDIIFASGIFNINLGNNMSFIEKAVECFHELSRDLVVFNLLHHRSTDKEAPYFYCNPDTIIEVVQQMEKSFKDVKIVENYLNNDFTVICKK